MNGEEAVDLLKHRMARFSGTSIDDYALDELKAAQRRLETAPFLPWFLITEKAVKDIPAGEERVGVPGDFLREVDDGAMSFVDTSGNRTSLRKMAYDDLVARYAAAGTPVGYTLKGEYFRVRPVPADSSTQLEMSYYSKDDEIQLLAENKWLANAAELLIAEAGLFISQLYIKNTSAAQFLSQLRQSEMRKLEDFSQAREDANSEYWTED